MSNKLNLPTILGFYQRFYSGLIQLDGKEHYSFVSSGLDCAQPECAVESYIQSIDLKKLQQDSYALKSFVRQWYNIDCYYHLLGLACQSGQAIKPIMDSFCRFNAAIRIEAQNLFRRINDRTSNPLLAEHLLGKQASTQISTYKLMMHCMMWKQEIQKGSENPIRLLLLATLFLMEIKKSNVRSIMQLRCFRCLTKMISSIASCSPDEDASSAEQPRIQQGLTWLFSQLPDACRPSDIASTHHVAWLMSGIQVTLDASSIMLGALSERILSVNESTTITSLISRY